LSLEAVEWARENGVEHAFQVSLESFGDDKKYDLIVLNDVVEHPLEPSKLIEKANSLLKSGGILSIWTPNNDNIFLDDQRKTLRVDLEHMQYLGSKACQYLSLTHNLNIVHYESLGYCTYSPNHNKNISKRILIFLLKFFHLYKLIKKIYSYIKFKNDRLGNYHLFVVLKKPLSNHIDRK
jgi:2-polyprenyl-3-methyl-5-hydroxy-6-metoxy-1,4-benzoquinol methylase